MTSVQKQRAALKMLTTISELENRHKELLHVVKDLAKVVEQDRGSGYPLLCQFNELLESEE